MEENDENGGLVVTTKLACKMKKRLLADYKLIIKRLNIAIKKLSKEIDEYINTINGFEEFITESVLFIKDRDSLITSHIRNLHKNRILALKSIFNRLPAWSQILSNADESVHKSVYYHGENILKRNEEMNKTIATMTKSADDDIDMVLDCIPRYIQNINIKLLNINKERNFLESLHSAAIEEYRTLKHLDSRQVKDIIDSMKIRH